MIQTEQKDRLHKIAEDAFKVYEQDEKIMVKATGQNWLMLVTYIECRNGDPIYNLHFIAPSGYVPESGQDTFYDGPALINLRTLGSKPEIYAKTTMSASHRSTWFFRQADTLKDSKVRVIVLPAGLNPIKAQEKGKAKFLHADIQSKCCAVDFETVHSDQGPKRWALTGTVFNAQIKPGGN